MNAVSYVDYVDLRAQAKKAAPQLPAAPHLNAAARATWRGRMINEYCSARVFEHLARQLEDAGFDDATVRACITFAGEERRHGVLCGAVLEALGAPARFERPMQDEFPEHEEVSRVEAALRNVISISCMSETVAVALVGAERLEMPDGPLRELLTSIYADEVGHARFGWRLVAELARRLDHDGRASTKDYLAVAFAALEEHELAHIDARTAPPPEGASLGICNGNDARTLFYETVAGVIIPGLERLGLPAADAWANRALAA